MSERDDDKPVSAQQAMEDFLMEMLPAQSDLPEQLKSDQPEPLAPVTARPHAAKTSKSSQNPQMVADSGKEKVAALEKLRPAEQEIAITRFPGSDILAQSLKAMDEINLERNERQIIEQERLEKEKLEQERLEQERLEQERLEQERLERERLEQERLEQERLEQERLEQERVEQKRVEQKRVEQEQRENQEQLAKSQSDSVAKQDTTIQTNTDDIRALVAFQDEVNLRSKVGEQANPNRSLAAQRQASRKKSESVLTQQTEFREPMPLEMKLLKARLASTLESSNPVVQTEEVKIEVSAEPQKQVETSAMETLTIEALAPPLPESAPLQALVETDHTDTSEQLEPDPWLDCGRPQWADGNFQVLLFTVAGLKMAVPLVSLGSIHPLVEDLTSLVGRAKWFIGLMPIHEQNVRVVDTALWVMPDRYCEGIREQYKYAISLADSDWGLACDDVAQAITLSPEEVRWRTERSKRPWLAGTVIEHMCALVDADMLRYQLYHAERP